VRAMRRTPATALAAPIHEIVVILHGLSSTHSPLSMQVMPG
jgi:hypothetical protein